MESGGSESGRGAGNGRRGERDRGARGIWQMSGRRYPFDGLFKQTATHNPPCGTVPQSPRLQHGACSAGQNTKGEPRGESDGRGNTYLDRISKPQPRVSLLSFFPSLPNFTTGEILKDPEKFGVDLRTEKKKKNARPERRPRGGD